MNKPLTSHRQGFANEKPSILTQTFPNNQESRISELSNYISDRRLAPYSQGTAVLSSLCGACGYTSSLLIIRFRDDRSLVRWGCCDAALYSVGLSQTEEVAV